MPALWQLGAWERFAWPALLMLALGLIAAFSRGPWVGTLVLVVAFVGTGSKAGTNLAKLGGVATLGYSALLLTGFAERIADFLPFVGSVDQFNVTYRERLFDNSLAVIGRNFWLGSTDYMSEPEMRELVQGEGIIDPVNSYLGIALDTGVIGLSLFAAFFASIMLELYRTIKRRFGKDRIYLNKYARAGFAILLGILVTIGTTSSIDYVPYIYWSFAGFCVALIRMARTSELSLRGPAEQMALAPDVARTSFRSRPVSLDPFCQ